MRGPIIFFLADIDAQILPSRGQSLCWKAYEKI